MNGTGLGRIALCLSLLMALVPGASASSPPESSHTSHSAASTTLIPAIPVDPSAQVNARAEEPTRTVNQLATPSNWISAERLGASLQLAVTMTLVGLLPAVLLMTTSYVRIAVVLAVLRQAFGLPSLLPIQVGTALAMFCTGLIMWPTWRVVHERAILPCLQGDMPWDTQQIWNVAGQPIRDFMVRQIEAQNNTDDVHLFLQHAQLNESYPTSYDQVPMAALLPAFLLSELKTAFAIGFQIYLPFLVIDLVVATVTTSMGMFMLPPSMIALPMKLLLFVMVDGWHLVIQLLLQSFQ